MKGLDKRFLDTVNVPRYRHGNKQELESLISEEVMLFAKYLRDERLLGFRELWDCLR